MNEPTNDQLLAIVNDTRIVLRDLRERVEKLEKENASLKETCSNFGLGIYTVEAMADRFTDWAQNAN